MLQRKFMIRLKKNIYLKFLLFIFIFVPMIILEVENLHKNQEESLTISDYFTIYRDFKLKEDALEKIITYAKDNNKDYISILTKCMLNHNLDLNQFNDEMLNNLSETAENSKEYSFLYDLNQSILSDVKCFPIPAKYIDEDNYITYENTWGTPRTYGGDRLHEGIDVMASNNIRGYFPIVSMTDGVIEKKGWLNQGGYRIGIRSPNGVYYYYAHLYSYAPNIELGDTIKAGELLGFMGDTGYSEVEGTTGNFPVHLHFGIYVDYEENEISINPYAILKYTEEGIVILNR